MTRENQIEELAEAIFQNCNCGLFFSEAEKIARFVIEEQGYRKQSEPFSFDHEKGVESVKLPCKVGDILYVISQTKDKRILPSINEFEVTSISIKKKSIVIYHEMDGYIKTFKQTDFGKTVFLTKKEAERAATDVNVGSK